MKLRAIRLASVGRFADPVAVEGLSGGLDVLAGPNETGKSTIFRALATLFERQHTATGKFLQDLRPYAGGEPLVEADFELGGKQWRLTKQYGRGKRAELSDLASGRLVARGAEAEARMDELFGAQGIEVRPSLLWVAQNALHMAERSKVDTARASTLSALVAREVESVAAGPEVRLVREKVDAALNELVQAKRRDKPAANKPLKLAMERRDRLAVELARAEAAADAAVCHLDELEQARRALSVAASPERRAALAEARAAASASVATGRAARMRLESVRAAARALGLEAEAADQALSEFDQRIEEAANLAERHKTAVAGAERLRRDIEAEDGAIAAAEAELTDIEEALRRVEMAHEALRKAEAKLAHRRRRDDLDRMLNEARGIEAGVARLAQALDANRVTAARMQRIDAAARELEVAESRRRAVLPDMEVALTEEGRRRVTVAGGRLADGRHVISGPTAIVIDGVGTITVHPGASADAARVDTLRAALAGLLADAGCADVDEARRLHAARIADEHALAAQRASLKSAAPNGSATLAAEVARLDAEIAAIADPDVPLTRAALDEEAAKRRQRRNEVKNRLIELTRRRRDAGEQHAGLGSAVASLIERQGQLSAMLPPPSARDGERARLAAAAAEARGKARDARQAAIAQEELAPSEGRIDELEAASRRAGEEEATVLAEAQRLEALVGKLEARIEADQELAAGREATRLSSELARVTAEVRRLETDVEALQLLDEVLATLETETRDRYLEPVTARVAGYSQIVLPGARLAMNEEFSVMALERGDQREAIDALSGGTREQLAVIVRLAMARLMADAGTPAPLVFDDTLVFTDRERMTRMHRALRDAAEHHQVLVLTCREDAIEALGGKRLDIKPWRAG